MINVPSLSVLAIGVVGHQTATRVRRSGSYVDGVYTAGPDVQAEFTGTITPARGRDVLRLEEGKRGEEAIRVITATELRAALPDGSTQPDQIVFNGLIYEVEHVERWDGAFHDAIAVRLGD